MDKMKSKLRSKKYRTKNPETAKKKSETTKKHARKLSNNKLVAVIFVSVITIILVACGILYFVNANRMDEVPIEDDEIVTLATRYFRGTDSCMDYNLGLFIDGTMSVRDLNYDTKEKLAIEYAISKRYDQIGYNELNEVYHLLFNDGTNLEKNDYYESTSGYYESSGNNYELYIETDCAATRPPEMVCLAMSKAYKSDNGAKIIYGVFSGTAETGYLYSGVNWDAEPLGIYGEIDLLEQEPNFTKWEANFKYDKKLKRYFLDSTKKL